MSSSSRCMGVSVFFRLGGLGRFGRFGRFSGFGPAHQRHGADRCLSKIIAFSVGLLWVIFANAESAPLLIGQSAGLTGGQAAYSADLRLGIEAYFAQANKQGVHGRTLKLVSLDDGGNRGRTLANTAQLIEKHNVFALLGYTSGAGVEASLTYIENARVPMLSPATGNMGIRTNFYRHLFHTRAGYADEMKRAVSSLSVTGVRRFAVVYLGDAGPENPLAMHEALSAAGLRAVADVPLDRNATDFSTQIAALAASRPEAVLMISNAKPIVSLVKGLRESGYRGYFVSSSFSGMSIVDELKEEGKGLIMVQVLPPYWRDHLRLVKDYQDHLKAHAPDASPNYTSLEGYISARVLVEGLRRAGANPTRERLIASLEGLKSLDLGGYEINFSGQSHDGSRFVNIGMIDAAGKLRF